MFFERTDKATGSYWEGYSWDNGSFAFLGSVQLRGKWVTNSDVLFGCVMSQEFGSFPATTAVSGLNVRKVLRIAVEGHKQGSGDTPVRPGLRVAAEARHSVAFSF